jgi:predicted deacylase
MKHKLSTIKHHSIILLATLCLLFLPLSACANADQGSGSNKLFQGTSASAPIDLVSPAATTASTLIPSRTPAPTHTPVVLKLPFASGAIVIGRSVAGRSIQVYRFGDGPIERLIVAGIHGGNEANTSQLAYELINYIQEHPDIIPEDVTLYILPLLNPDGAARSQDANGRVNDRGVDLNRNWDANWQAEWARNGCWNQGPSTGGAFAMSEPEIIALANFISSRNFDGILNYHSAALGIFAGGQPPLESAKSLAATVSAVSPYPYPPVDTGCIYTGQFVDWAANQGIAALDIELSYHVGTEFEINLEILKVFLSWRWRLSE